VNNNDRINSSFICLYLLYLVNFNDFSPPLSISKFLQHFIYLLLCLNLGQYLKILLLRIHEFKVIAYPLHWNPMPRANLEDLMQYVLSSKDINEIPKQLIAIFLLSNCKYIVSSIKPLCGTILLLQGNHQYIHIIIPSKDVLVGIDKLIRKRIANLIHRIFTILAPPQYIVHTMQPAQQRSPPLLLEMRHLLIILLYCLVLHISSIVILTIV
jgi:hypothetical protein